MRKKLTVALMGVSLMIPYAAPWVHSEEGKAEKAESLEHQRHEEQEALKHYNKAVAKHGKESPEAKKAWKHYVHEMKEHGHEADIQK